MEKGLAQSSANGGSKAKHTEARLVELKISFYSTFLWVYKELHCKYTPHSTLTSTSNPLHTAWLFTRCHWAECVAYGGGKKEMRFIHGYQGDLWGTLKMKTWDGGCGLLKLATTSQGVFSFRRSTCSQPVRQGPITTARQRRLANDRQLRINRSGEGSGWRPAEVTKAIFEEAEWTANETLDPKW